MARWWLKTQIPFTRMIITGRFSLSFCYRLAVSDCAPQTSRVSSNLHSSSSMAVSRVPSPPPPEVNTPVAENWCYTQVRFAHRRGRSRESSPARFRAIDPSKPKFVSFIYINRREWRNFIVRAFCERERKINILFQISWYSNITYIYYVRVILLWNDVRSNTKGLIL